MYASLLCRTRTHTFFEKISILKSKFDPNVFGKYQASNVIEDISCRPLRNDLNILFWEKERPMRLDYQFLNKKHERRKNVRYARALIY